jgi:hypothetical protein
MVKQTVAQSMTIARGKEDRALFGHRADGIRHPFRRSAALTPPPPSSVAPGKARFRVSGMISPMEAISLTKDLPIDGARERAEEAGLSNTPSLAARFLSTVTQTTRYRLPGYLPRRSMFRSTEVRGTYTSDG